MKQSLDFQAHTRSSPWAPATASVSRNRPHAPLCMSQTHGARQGEHAPRPSDPPCGEQMYPAERHGAEAPTFLPWYDATLPWLQRDPPSGGRQRDEFPLQNAATGSWFLKFTPQNPARGWPWRWGSWVRLGWEEVALPSLKQPAHTNRVYRVRHWQGSAWRSQLLACALQVFCYVLACQVSGWHAATSHILLQQRRGQAGKVLSVSDVLKD